MSEIILKPSDFIKIKEKSTYNCDFYKSKHPDCCREIKEYCHEDWEFFEYSIVYGKEEMLLGCSRETLHGLDGNIDVIVDLLVYYS